jgi:nicotinic acid mononucleotide adenylyltransferase/exonuclease VII small subunit
MADNEDMKADEKPLKDAEKVADDKPATKSKSKQDKEDEILVKNVIDISPKLEEAEGRTVVMGWGRMNPITSGHEKLVKRIMDVARKENGTPIIYLTHSQDPKKNPLSYDDKVMLARKAFGNVIQKSNSKTIIQALSELQKKYKHVILVAGADRIKEFETLINKYNGRDYTFDSITVVSAGERTDPDSDAAMQMSADTMSASVMRKLASEGDMETFKKGLPSKLKRDAQDVYDMVRAGMKLAEEMELDEAVLNFQQRRQRALTMRRFKTKLAAARKRMRRRISSKETLQKKARKAAINIIRSKIAGAKGANYKDLNPAEKIMIDKRLQTRKGAINRLSKRMLPTVRKADIARVSAAAKTKNEDVNENFESFVEAYQNSPTKRFHELRKKDGTMKLDKRFRAFRNAATSISETPLEDAKQRMRANHKSERENLKNQHDDELDNLTARGLRSQIRSLNKEENVQILEWIAEISDQITDSVELEEAKALKSLVEKSQKSGAPLDEIMAIYEDARETCDQQWAFSCVNNYIAEGKKNGLWDNINAKQKRIKAGSGEKMRKPGSEGAPTAQDFKDASEESSPLKEKGLWDNINAKQKRIKSGSGEKMRKPGSDGAPTNQDFKDSRTEAASPEDRMYDAAAKVLMSILARKDKETTAQKDAKKFTRGPAHSVGYYAAQVARSYPNMDARRLEGMVEEHGAGDWGTTKLSNKYKKDTPGQSVNEAFEALMEAECQLIGMKQIKEFEKVVDNLFKKYDIDFNFTRHFGDRMSDERNTPCITLKELADFIKKIYAKQGKSLKGVAGAEAVIKDMQTDLNIPVAVTYDAKNDEFDVVMKTIMRKKNFKSPDKFITY